MSEARMYEFFLVRLMPDPLRGECINIGVALYRGDGTFADVRILSDLSHVRRLSPGFDPADLDGLEDSLRQRIRDAEPGAREALLAAVADAWSQSLQLTPPTGVLAVDPHAELESLYRRYVAPAEAVERERSQRALILDHLQRTFEEQHVLAHLRRRVAVRELLPDAGGDAFRFDFYYKPNGVHKVVQAAPLGADEARIKTLCFTAGEFRARLEGGATLDLTAVVNDMPEADAEEWKYQLELLRSSGLIPRRWQEASRIAAEIRAQLRLA